MLHRQRQRKPRTEVIVLMKKLIKKKRCGYFSRATINIWGNINSNISNNFFTNFKKSHLHKKEHKTKEEDVTCSECVKLGQYRATCLSLNKHHKNNNKGFYMTKINMSKIVESISFGKKKTWALLHLPVQIQMINVSTHAWWHTRKVKTLTYIILILNLSLLIKKLSKAFIKMHAYALNVFKKNSLQRKVISNLEKEINDLKSSLDSLK